MFRPLEGSCGFPGACNLKYCRPAVPRGGPAMAPILPQSLPGKVGVFRPPPTFSRGSRGMIEGADLYKVAPRRRCSPLLLAVLRIYIHIGAKNQKKGFARIRRAGSHGGHQGPKNSFGLRCCCSAVASCQGHINICVWEVYHRTMHVGNEARGA